MLVRHLLQTGVESFSKSSKRTRSSSLALPAQCFSPKRKARDGASTVTHLAALGLEKVLPRCLAAAWRQIHCSRYLSTVTAQLFVFLGPCTPILGLPVFAKQYVMPPANCVLCVCACRFCFLLLYFGLELLSCCFFSPAFKRFLFGVNAWQFAKLIASVVLSWSL